MPILPAAARPESRRAPVHLGAAPHHLLAAFVTVLGESGAVSNDEVWVQALSPGHAPDVYRIPLAEYRAAKAQGRAARDVTGRAAFHAPLSLPALDGTLTPVPGVPPLTARARLDGLTGPHETPSHVVSVRGATPDDLRDTLSFLLGAAHPHASGQPLATSAHD